MLREIFILPPRNSEGIEFAASRIADAGRALLFGMAMMLS
jgi:hypothetical protein